MSSGPVVALVLAKEDAITKWRQVMGPTNPQVARESFPDTVRAIYGKGSDFTQKLIFKSILAVFPESTDAPLSWSP